MKRFEYRVLDVSATGFWGGKVDAQELTNKLNELGREGWELTSSVDLNMTQGASVSVLIMLKRELQ
ncbi:DUF4177 domain-containing protein [Spirosoma rhododendri]|uniref:DUF4177 domain-containing protein n=1 Tax=Spirosoma rhododendri TaxID=2728024 RepID=A0A7L5DKQ5_9BACT|nr:DUF4177 domain-containing protein [Spirosoma rhododendri]QJD76978.1 DUF4177 domain-containing protein [Spirosoma rhododendri]